VWFQKISKAPPQRVRQSEEKGVLKAKLLKGKYEPKLEFPKGWGVQTKKNLCRGSMDIFWNNTICSRGEFFHTGNFTTFVQFISRQLIIINKK